MTFRNESTTAPLEIAVISRHATDHPGNTNTDPIRFGKLWQEELAHPKMDPHAQSRHCQ